MKQFSYVLTNESSLHARPLGSLAKEAARFQSCVRIVCGEETAGVDAPRAVMALGMKSGDKVTVTVEGRDEEAAVAAVQNYFVANM